MAKKYIVVNLDTHNPTFADGSNYRPVTQFVCACGDTVNDRLKHDVEKHWPDRDLTVYGGQMTEQEEKAARG